MSRDASGDIMNFMWALPPYSVPRLLAILRNRYGRACLSRSRYRGFAKGCCMQQMASRATIYGPLSPVLNVGPDQIWKEER